MSKSLTWFGFGGFSHDLKFLPGYWRRSLTVVLKGNGENKDIDVIKSGG